MPQRVQTLRSSTKKQRPAPGAREIGELFINFPDVQLGVIDTAKNPLDLIAVRFFSALTDYVIGDFVVQAGRGYRAKANITAGAFNPLQWDTLPIVGEFEPPIAMGTVSQYWRGDKSWQTLNSAAVGLGNVNNTSDASKPVSTAQQAALDLKANLAGPTTFTGVISGPTPAAGTNTTQFATTAFVAGSYAPIASPTFLGDPKAPTPATADSDTSIATTAYVQANLINYAPLVSPVFTGNPTAPTPGVGDNDTSIATTAFVKSVSLGDANADNLIYGRKNNTWVEVAPASGGASATLIADIAPSTPIPGQLWWESDSGNTYIYYNDGTSAQWVQQNVGQTDWNTLTNVPSAFPPQPHDHTRLLNGTGTASVDGAGNFTSTGALLSGSYVYAANGVFLGYSSNVVIAPNGAGPIYLRPNGSALAAGQFTVDTAGNTVAYGQSQAPSFLSTTATGVATVGSNQESAGMYVGRPLRSDVVGVNLSIEQLHNTTGGYAATQFTVHGVVFQLVSDTRALKLGGGPWGDYSDARIKTVKGDYESGLEQILALRPVRYTFKGNDTDALPSNTRRGAEASADKSTPTVPYPNSFHYQAAVDQMEFVGLIAQEAETVMPDLVSQHPGYIDGEAVEDIRNLDAANLTYALVNAVQDMKAIIDAQAERIAALEAASGV